jgi:hypothetical protein
MSLFVPLLEFNLEGLDRVDHEHPRRLDLGRLQDPLGERGQDTAASAVCNPA